MKTDDFRLACDSAIQFSEWAITDREKDLGGSSDNMLEVLQINEDF